MYAAFLLIHSTLRWVVLALALVALVRAIRGIAGRREWLSADQSIGAWFTGSLDLQLLLGLVLYFFLSPFTREAFGDFGAAMRNAPLRFIAVEHITGMIIAVALAHIGRVRTKKAADAASRHRSALIFYGLALVIMLLSIPWPGMPGGRPLFRGFGDTAAYVGSGFSRTSGTRDMLGARVEIVRKGKPSLWRRSRADGSYASANDPRTARPDPKDKIRYQVAMTQARTLGAEKRFDEAIRVLAPVVADEPQITEARRLTGLYALEIGQLHQARQMIDGLLKEEPGNAAYRLDHAVLPDRRGELAAVLAMHFEQAGDAERAVRYAMEAMRESPVKEFFVSTARRNGHVVLKFQDTGRPLPVEVKEAILRDRPGQELKGEGAMRLLLAISLVRKYAAKFEIGHEAGINIFSVEIPCQSVALRKKAVRR